MYYLLIIIGRGFCTTEDDLQIIFDHFTQTDTFKSIRL